MSRRPAVPDPIVAELPALWGRLRGVAQHSPELLDAPSLVFARRSHMRVLSKRAKASKLQGFLWELGMCQQHARQVVFAPEGGRSIPHGAIAPGVAHLIEDALVAPLAQYRETAVPQPVQVACGATVPAIQTGASWWELSAPARCPQCERVADRFSEAWAGRQGPGSVIAPMLPLSARERIVAAIAGEIPSVLDRAWPRAQGALADAAAAELWRCVAELAVEPVDYGQAPLPADFRVGATRRQSALLREAAEKAGVTGPLIARLSPSDWERIFADTRGHNQQARVIRTAVAATLGDPMLVAALA